MANIPYETSILMMMMMMMTMTMTMTTTTTTTTTTTMTTNHLHKPSTITKHQETNMLNLSQPWMCFQCYDQINESMKILHTHVIIHKCQRILHNVTYRSIIYTIFHPYTGLLSNRLPPGPIPYRTGNPRERFPTSPEITGVRFFNPARWFTLTGLSRNANVTLTGIPPTLRD